MNTQQGSAKAVWIVIIVIILALLVWWIAGTGPAEAPTEEQTLSSQIEDDETAEIAAELEGLNEADLEAEFSDIEKDMEQL